MTFAPGAESAHVNEIQEGMPVVMFAIGRHEAFQFFQIGSQMMFSTQYANHLSTVISGDVTIRLCRSSYLASASQFFASGSVSKYFSLRLPFFA